MAKRARRCCHPSPGVLKGRIIIHTCDQNTPFSTPTTHAEALISGAHLTTKDDVRTDKEDCMAEGFWPTESDRKSDAPIDSLPRQLISLYQTLKMTDAPTPPVFDFTGDVDVRSVMSQRDNHMMIERLTVRDLR